MDVSDIKLLQAIYYILVSSFSIRMHMSAHEFRTFLIAELRNQKIRIDLIDEERPLFAANNKVREVSDKCGLALTSLTTMLERMEKTGLIHREQDGKDRRKTKLYLTEKARDLQNDYDEVSKEMTDIYYNGFSSEEIDLFESYLDRIRENLEGWGIK